MKKIFTSLLLLVATVVTANAEMRTVWEGTHEIGNWDWNTRLELPANTFADIADGGQLVVTVTRNTTAAGEEQWFNYEIMANDYVAGRTPERTTLASGTVEADGDVTVSLDAAQAALLRDYGLIVNGKHIIVTKVAVDAQEAKEGTTTTLWEGTPVTIGDWSGALQLSYDNKPQGLATAKVGDLITVTCTTTGDDAQVQIANPEGWQPFDEDAHAALPAGSAAQTFSYEIPNVATLELIQFNGIIVNGKNITISKVELTTYPDSYDAVEITIDDAGIATYSNSSKSLDFTNADVTAYYATAVETGKVTLTPVTYVPAYTGIIVKGTPGPHVVMTGEGENNATNLLKAIGDWEQEIKASTTEIFNYNFDETSATFSLITVNTKIPARKAYLETTIDITPEPGSIELVFTDDTSTGINEIETEVQESGDNSYYNLQGMRVEHPTKGIYIHKGKKIIIR